MNVKYGIINVRMLIKLNEQLNSFLGKNLLEIYINAMINEMDSLFYKTANNILSNYILHETITCDDKDPP